MGSILGGLTGGSSTTTNSSGASNADQTNQSQTSLGAQQMPYVAQQWGAAQQAYNADAAVGPYQGTLYSGLNSTQQGAANQAAGYASGTGQNLAQTSAGTAGQLYGAASPYLNNASSIAQNGIAGPNAGAMNTLNGYASGQMGAQGASSGLSGALNSAATQGAASLPSLYNNIESTALGNNTGQTIANASQYANSGYTQQSINADNAQIAQTLNESTLPGLNQQAAAGGSLDSSRAGMAEAQANQGAALDEGLTDASLQNNAFNTGVNASTTQLESGLSNANYAAGTQASNVLNDANLQQNLSEYNAGNQLSAANSSLGNQLNYEEGNANTQLSGNSQLGNALSLANTSALTSANQASTNYNLGSTAGSLYQNDANAQNAANYTQYLNNTQTPFNLLDQYASLVDSPLTTSTTGAQQAYQNYNDTSTQTQNQSGISNVLGSAVGIGSLLSLL
jgi:hypothetical protein